MLQDYPSKLYYSISEVAKITGVKAHVLRYWETEFSTLKPRKTRTGSRRYRQIDIDEILAIKGLLYEEGFKIAGALKIRRQAKRKVQEAVPQEAPQMNLGFEGGGDSKQIGIVKDELKEILMMVRELSDQSGQYSPQADKKEKKGKA